MAKAKAPKKFKFPKGFKKHNGKGCPVDETTYVETIIRTDDGFGSGGVTQAKYHDWINEAHVPQGGLGEVVGYRLADRGETPKFAAHERF